MADGESDLASPADGSRRETPPSAPRPALARFLVWSLVGGVGGIVLMTVVFALAHRDSTPALTPELFDAAHQRWQASGPADYDIEVRVSGPQAAEYRVEIRGGQPQAAWRNGQPLTSRRTFGTWSVPGMFSTISRDIEALERFKAGRERQELILRAAFDPRYSYPQRYRRIEWGSRKGSDAVTVSWEVTEFKVVSGQ
jgi:hypothetical protein